MNTPRVLTQGMAILALALLMAACEDGPTLPDGGGEIEAQAAAALQQGAVQAQTLVEESLARLPEGQLPAGRVQTESSDPHPAAAGRDARTPRPRASRGARRGAGRRVRGAR